MPDGNPQLAASKDGLLVTIYRSIDPSVRALILMLLGLGAFMLFFTALPHAMTAVPVYIKHLTQSPVGAQHCWDLREMQGIVYSFNKCTGETLRVAVEPVAKPASAPQSPASK